MDQLRPQLPFCSKYYDCKLLEILYLIVSQQSVNLMGRVTLTDKTEHSSLSAALCVSLRSLRNAIF
jgi:hypothetical protein